MVGEGSPTLVLVSVTVETTPFGNVVLDTVVKVDVVVGVEVGGGVSGGGEYGGSVGEVTVHEVVNRVSGWLIVVVTKPSAAMVTRDVLPVSHTRVSKAEG